MASFFEKLILVYVIFSADDNIHVVPTDAPISMISLFLIGVQAS